MAEMPQELENAHAGAFLFYAIAIALVGVGFYVMFTYQPGGSEYDPGFGEVVGGDAYNFIIIAVRGAGFIAAGGVSAVFGLAATISHEQRRARWVLEHWSAP